MARMIGILGAVCFFSALILGLTYQLTRPVIAERQALDEQKALQAVFPSADRFAPVADRPAYQALAGDGTILGYCLIAESPGYSSTIRLAVGIDKTGLIQGVKVLSQQETPGLGTRICEVRPGETDEWFLRQFRGKNGSTVQLDQVNAITGATVTSRAVTDGIRKTVHEFMEKSR